jgi:Fic family protein
VLLLIKKVMPTVIEFLEKADALKAELDDLRPIQTDRMARVMQKLRLDWNYHSNSMEGNTLTLSETRAFILYGITAKGKPFRDYVEMRGHNEALKQLEQVVHKDLRLTERIIKDFHKTILVEPFQDELAEINPGQYKKFGNYLYSPQLERIDFEPPEEVPRLVNELVNWTNNHLFPEELSRKGRRKYDFHPILVACYFHLRFIRIHPFGDGNGRMGRILMNLILMIKGYMPVIVRLENREEYYSVLNQSDTNNIEPLAVFILQNLIESLELTIKGAKGESIEDADDWQKELSLLQLAMKQNDVSNGIKKSDALILRLYEVNFRHIFSRFFEKMVSFQPFFEEFEKWTSINNGVEKSGKGLAYLDGNLAKQEDISSISATCKGQKWKPQLAETAVFQLDFVVDFHDNVYKIKANGLSFEKKYTELLTEEEITAMIQAVGKLGLEKIKNVMR